MWRGRGQRLGRARKAGRAHTSPESQSQMLSTCRGCLDGFLRCGSGATSWLRCLQLSNSPLCYCHVAYHTSPLPVRDPGNRSSGQAAIEATCLFSISKRSVGFIRGEAKSDCLWMDGGYGCWLERATWGLVGGSCGDLRAGPGFSGHIMGSIPECRRVRVPAGAAPSPGDLFSREKAPTQGQDEDGPVGLSPPAVAGALWGSRRSPQCQSRTWYPGWS